MVWGPRFKFCLNFSHLQCHLISPFLQYPYYPQNQSFIASLLSLCSRPPYTLSGLIILTQPPPCPSPSSTPAWLPKSCISTALSSFRSPERGFRVRTLPLHCQEFHLISSPGVYSHQTHETVPWDSIISKENATPGLLEYFTSCSMFSLERNWRMLCSWLVRTLGLDWH